MAAHDKLVIVTRKTALEELVERFNTRDQARFYIEHMGGDFASTRRPTTPITPPSRCSARPCPGASAPSGSTGPSCRPSRLATPTWSSSWARTAWSSTRPSISRSAAGGAQPRPGADRRRPLAVRRPRRGPGHRPGPGPDGRQCWQRRDHGRRPSSTTASGCWRSTTCSSAPGPTSRPATASATRAARRTSRRAG